MKIVALDKTHIDYFKGVIASRRGLTACFGIRVDAGGCSALATIGDGQPFMFGKYYPVPVEIDTLPSPVRMVVDDHVLKYPSSI
jgi:hypothetical protein